MTTKNQVPHALFLKEPYIARLCREAKVDGFTPGEQEEDIEELEYFTARLVNRCYHGPPVHREVPYCLGHKKCRGTVQYQQLSDQHVVQISKKKEGRGGGGI